MISGRVLGQKELQAGEFQDYPGDFGNSRSLLHVHEGWEFKNQASGFAEVCSGLRILSVCLKEERQHETATQQIGAAPDGLSPLTFVFCSEAV